MSNMKIPLSGEVEMFVKAETLSEIVATWCDINDNHVPGGFKESNTWIMKHAHEIGTWIGEMLYQMTLAGDKAINQE